MLSCQVAGRERNIRTAQQAVKNRDALIRRTVQHRNMLGFVPAQPPNYQDYKSMRGEHSDKFIDPPVVARQLIPDESGRARKMDVLKANKAEIRANQR